MQSIKFSFKMPIRIKIILDKSNCKSNFLEIIEQIIGLGFVKGRDFYIDDKYKNQITLSISEYKMDYELTQEKLDNLSQLLDENFHRYNITVLN